MQRVRFELLLVERPGQVGYRSREIVDLLDDYSVFDLVEDRPRCQSGQEKGATFPTSKVPISAVFHSFWLIFGRAIIPRSGLEASMFFRTHARGTLTLKRR